MASGYGNALRVHDSLQSAAKSVQYQVLLQFASRLLTFILNGFIIHYVSKELLGIVNIRLMLLYSTVQFLSREGFRRACTEQFGQKPHEWKPIVNLLWLNTPLCMVFSVGLSILWYYGFERPPDNAEHNFIGHYYKYGIVAYAAAACIESISEPFFVTAQAYHFVRTRVIIQGAAVIIQTCVNAAGCAGVLRGVWWLGFTTTSADHQRGERSRYLLIVFACAQLCYSTSIVVMYVLFFGYHLHRRKKAIIKKLLIKEKNEEITALPMQSILDFLPSIFGCNDAGARISQKHARLAYSFVKQGFLKQLLTEGERYLMTITSVLDFRQQGIYDIVNNLGALCVRTVFAPLEENAYLFFARAFPRNLPIKDNTPEQLENVKEVGHEETPNNSLKRVSDAEIMPDLNDDCSAVPPRTHTVTGKGDAVDSDQPEADNYSVGKTTDVSLKRRAAGRLPHSSSKAKQTSVNTAVPELGADADEQRRHSLDALHHLLRFVVLLSLTAFTYGFNYCDILLRLYGGNELVLHGTRMMQTYCFYLIFLAINGIMEAFAFAVMTDEQVQQSYKAFAKVSVVYVSSAFLLTWVIRRDATGFILANCINMLVRIVYSYGVATRYLKRVTEQPQDTDLNGNSANLNCQSSSLILHALVPHNMVIKSLVLAGLFCYSSKKFIYQASMADAIYDGNNAALVTGAVGAPLISLPTCGHLLIGGLFGLITLWCVWMFERSTVVFIRDILRGRQQNSRTEEHVPSRVRSCVRNKAE